MIRAERGALLRAVTAEALREADREVVRTPLTRRSDVRFRGQTGKHFPILSCTGFDPNRTMRALICCAAQTTCCRARLTGVPPREGQVRRRRATSRKPAKAQQKTKAKRGTASKPARNRHVTALRKDTKIARLARELAEGREQQAATSELLKVIGRSTLDLQPVFETLAENAVRLCEAKRSFIYRFDGQYLRVVATHSASPEMRAFVEQNPIAPGRGSATARAALERRTVQVLDAQGDPEYTYGSRQVDPFRTIITVPILRGTSYSEQLAPIGMRFEHLLKVKSHCWRPSPLRPSLPSRMRACSTSCANRCISRPPPPTCSRSSAARLSISRPCSILLFSRRPSCARPIPASFDGARAISIPLPRPSASPRSTANISSAIPLSRIAEESSGAR